MKSLSIEEALQWTQRLVLREWRLLLPVALAFLALPQLAFGLLLPPSIQAAMVQLQMQPTQAPAAPVVQAAYWLLPVALLIQLITLLGMLAIVSLALVPRISVREALTLAARRLWVFVAAFLCLFVALLLIVTVLALLLTLLHVGLASEQAMLIGVMLGIAVVFSVRLAVLAPVILASRAGPIAALRLAWELTEGAFWRLAMGLLAYGVGALVVLLASTFAIGTIFVLVANALGVPLLGTILSTLYVSFARACLSTGLLVLTAAFYRQLGGPIRGI